MILPFPQASNTGGTTVVRRGPEAGVTASLIAVAVAAGNADHNSASVPVTKGVAALVPPNVSEGPFTPRLVISSPGAISPRLPSVLPRFDTRNGRPCRSQATTGRTHGWRVIAVLPSVP